MTMTKSKPIYKKYDDWVIDKIREIEPATAKQISEALGNKSSQSTWGMLKRLCKEELIYVDITIRPYKYMAKERLVSYD